MSEVSDRDHWVELASRRLPFREENALLGQILAGQEVHRDSLVLVADDPRCSSLARCAAIQRYVQLFNEDARELLTNLSDPDAEKNEDVRFTALLWLLGLG